MLWTRGYNAFHGWGLESRREGLSFQGRIVFTCPQKPPSSHPHMEDSRWKCKLWGRKNGRFSMTHKTLACFWLWSDRVTTLQINEALGQRDWPKHCVLVGGQWGDLTSRVRSIVQDHWASLMGPNHLSAAHCFPQHKQAVTLEAPHQTGQPLLCSPSRSGPCCLQFLPSADYNQMLR